MSQEIRILRWCDNTTKHGEDNEVAAEPVPPIAIGKDKPRDLDLCPACRLELVEPLLALLDKEGRAVDTGRRKNRKRKDTTSSAKSSSAERAIAKAWDEVAASVDGLYQCPECDHEPFQNERGLRTHMSMKHPDEPNLLTANEQVARRGGSEFVCPEPECGRAFKDNRALGAHRSRKHGYRAGDDDT